MKPIEPVTFKTENGAEDPVENKRKVRNVLLDVYKEGMRFDMESPNELQTPAIQANPSDASSIWEHCTLDFTKFYQDNGSKITKGLKSILLKLFIKKYAEEHFAEFCKRVGELYIEVDITASIVKPYFTDRETRLYGSDDGSSCFRPGGCNESNGVFIDKSNCTGVICLAPPEGSRYAPGRMILFVKSGTEAHLLNQYTTNGRTSLPYSIFVRALEHLSGTKIRFHKVDSSGPDSGFLPVYTNSGNVVCTAIEGTFGTLTDHPGRFSCPACGDHFTLSTGSFEESGSDHLIGCCPDCYETDSSCCSSCGERLSEDDCYHSPGGEDYCESCHHDRYSFCECCSEDVDSDDMCTVHDERGREIYMCTHCRRNSGDFFECEKCGDWFHNNTRTRAEDTDSVYCEDCAGEVLSSCSDCDLGFEELTEIDGEYYCTDCKDSHKPEEEEEEEPAEESVHLPVYTNDVLIPCSCSSCSGAREVARNNGGFVPTHVKDARETA